MLKKKLCKKCWINITHGELMIWDEGDDKEWKKGIAECPEEYIEEREEQYRKTTDKPPGKCPFILEHIL